MPVFPLARAAVSLQSHKAAAIEHHLMQRQFKTSTQVTRRTQSRGTRQLGITCPSAATSNLAETVGVKEKVISLSFLRDPNCFSFILNNEKVFLQYSHSFKRLYVFKQSILLLPSPQSETPTTTREVVEIPRVLHCSLHRETVCGGCEKSLRKTSPQSESWPITCRWR